MKKLLYILPLLLSLNSCIRNSCVANIEYFKDGEILCADSVIQNDLIVMDAYRLNISMSFLEQKKIEGSDKDIADLFYKYCKLLSK